MKIKVLITAFVLCLALPAAAQFTTTQLAHEVALNELRLPSHPSGTIGFKTCNDCEYQTKRVSANITYELNGEQVKLAKFREAVSHVRKRSEETVVVLQHLEDDVITKVSIYL